MVLVFLRWRFFFHCASIVKFVVHLSYI